jgi:hypothetical protein
MLVVILTWGILPVKIASNARESLVVNYVAQLVSYSLRGNGPAGSRSKFILRSSRCDATKSD